MTDVVYLRNLADRLFRVPGVYGTDQYDCDRLQSIADSLKGGSSASFKVIVHISGGVCMNVVALDGDKRIDIEVEVVDHDVQEADKGD